MNKGVGQKISASFGTVVEVDVAGDGGGWGRYLCIRIELDLTRPLEREWALNLEGNTHWVSFKYEKLPLFCFICGRILHLPTGCPGQNQARRNMDKSSGGRGYKQMILSRFRGITPGATLHGQAEGGSLL